jgi:hypothetical protein
MYNFRLPSHKADPARSLIDPPVYGHKVFTSGETGARDDHVVKFINSETTGYFFLGHAFAIFVEKKDAEIFRLWFGK